jgi:Ca2+-transporting ATPase
MRRIDGLEIYQKSVEDVCREYSVIKEIGLSKEEAIARQNRLGFNRMSPKVKKSFVVKVMEKLKEPLILVLLISSFISILVGEYIDGFGIFAAVAVATFIALFQEEKANRAWDLLSRSSEDYFVKVRRVGMVQKIRKSELTIGDIVYLEQGFLVPADGRVIHETHLHVNESMITGASVEVKKETNILQGEDLPIVERKNMVYSGSLVTQGRGEILVTGIGDFSEFGKIACEMKDDFHKMTPLQQKLGVLGKRISVLGTSGAMIIFLFKLIETLHAQTESTIQSSLDIFYSIKQAFVVSVALIVAAVPEGLPTLFAITLALNIKRMASNEILVRKIAACENLGSLNVICSDKTGTLTTNHMKVVNVWYGGDQYHTSAIDSKELLQNFCLNSSADLLLEQDNLTFLGNRMECALLVNAGENEMDYREVRKRYGNPIMVFEYTSERKMMSSVFQIHQKNVVYSKGSPERIFEVCANILYKGTVVPFSQRLQNEVMSEIFKLQKYGIRIMAFSHRCVNPLNGQDVLDFESEMIFTGFVGIEDSLRDEVKKEIFQCQQAGIDVKILTEDHLETAKAIASQLDIVKKGTLMLDASDVDKMSDYEFAEKLDHILVIARCNALTKIRTVNLLKIKHYSVAMIGDGLSDMTSLEEADVSFARGDSEYEVAKKTADITLKDDSLSAFVQSVKWGRGVFENVQRFLQFQLSVNVFAFSVAFTAELLGDLPFTPLQFLWVNVIMDGPLALSLGLEPPREELLQKKALPRGSSLLSMPLISNILIHGGYMFGVMILLLKTNVFFGEMDSEDLFKKTIAFNAFVFLTLWHSFNCREFGTRSIFPNLLKNRIMLIAVGVAFAFQVIFTQYGTVLFGTTPLDVSTWIRLFVITFSVIVFSEMVKGVRRGGRILFGERK